MQDQETPPDVLLRLMGAERRADQKIVDRLVRQALSGMEKDRRAWFRSLERHWIAPMEMQIGLTGHATDEVSLKGLVDACAEGMDAALRADVSGFPAPLGTPDGFEGWNAAWGATTPNGSSDEDRDLSAATIDWTLMLLVATARIIGPVTEDELDRMRSHCRDATCGLDPSDDAHVADVACRTLIRSHGIRMANVDGRRESLLRSQFGRGDQSDDAVSTAWEIHRSVHRTMHLELDRRGIEPGMPMSIATTLLDIDLRLPAGDDPSYVQMLAVAAVHGAIRAALMAVGADERNYHPFSEHVAAMRPDELAEAIRSRDPETIATIDAIADRAFVHQAVESTNVDVIVADMPHLHAKVHEIVAGVMERNAHEESMHPAYPDLVVHAAVHTVMACQRSDPPEDPVWAAASDEMDVDHRLLANPDPLSNERIGDAIDGPPLETGTIRVIGLAVHCVDPDADEKTARIVSRIVPDAGRLVPGDLSLKRIASMPGTVMTVREARALADRIRDECGVHGSYLVGTSGWRQCVVVSNEDLPRTVVRLSASNDSSRN